MEVLSSGIVFDVRSYMVKGLYLGYPGSIPSFNSYNVQQNTTANLNHQHKP